MAELRGLEAPAQMSKKIRCPVSSINFGDGIDEGRGGKIVSSPCASVNCDTMVEFFGASVDDADTCKSSVKCPESPW